MIRVMNTSPEKLKRAALYLLPLILIACGLTTPRGVPTPPASPTMAMHKINVTPTTSPEAEDSLTATSPPGPTFPVPPKATQPPVTSVEPPAEDSPGACVPLDAEVAYGLVAWVDSGDSLVVDMQGEYKTIRYLGVEVSDEATQSTARNEELVRDQVVKMVAGPVDADQFGQLLRYVFVGETFINYALLREGQVTLDATYQGACVNTFGSAQQTAQTEQLGLWQSPEIGGVLPSATATSPPGATAQPTWTPGGTTTQQATGTQPATATEGTPQPTTTSGATATRQVTSSIPTATEGTAAPTVSVEESEIYVVDIFFNGDPNKNESDEHVEIINVSIGPVDLAGWRLKVGDDGAEMTMGSYLLEPFESCYIFTNETRTDVCSFSFESSTPLWDAGGACANLYDPNGTLFDFLCYGSEG